MPICYEKKKYCLIAPVLLFLLFAAGCAGRKDTSFIPKHQYKAGQFVLADGTPASADNVAQLLDYADYVLVGERHDSFQDHHAQAVLLEMAARKKESVLGLEMLPRNRYDTQLTGVMKGLSNLEELPKLVDWGKNWGYDFALYRPVFAMAKQYGARIAGLNLPNNLRLAVSRKGLKGLTLEEKAQLPALIVPPLPEQREKLATFFSLHHALIAQGRAILEKDGTATKKREQASVTSMQERLERFLLIQSLWDSTMAEQAVRVRKQAPYPAGDLGNPGAHRPLVFILAGAGHVEHGYGIASRIKVLDPKTRILTVMPFSGERPEPGAASLFFYSPYEAKPPPAPRNTSMLRALPKVLYNARNIASS